MILSLSEMIWFLVQEIKDGKFFAEKRFKRNYSLRFGIFRDI